MTSRTRYFVIGSLLVLGVGLGTGLVAYYVGLPVGFGAAQAGPDELRYVPPDATVLAYADVAAIMDSGVRQRIRAAIPVPGEGQREFQEKTGIDIESDIDHVVASIQPVAAGRTAPLVVARGRFSEAAVEKAMREQGAQIDQYNGRRIMTYRNASLQPDEPFAVSFVEPGLMAVGSPQTVRAAIDSGTGGASVTGNGELMDKVKSLDAGNAWAVGRVDTLTADGRLPEQLSARLPAITWVALSGRVGDEVTGVFRADTRDEAAANDLRDVVRGFLALANLQAGSRPELQTTLQSLQLGGSGNSVTLSFRVPGEAFDAFAAPR